MPSTNWHSQVSSGETGGDDRNQLPSGARHKMVYMIMETIKRQHPTSRIEGLLDIGRIALLFEKNIFDAATSPTDYIRNISLKMLEYETRFQNPNAPNVRVFTRGEFDTIVNNLLRSAAIMGLDGSDWRVRLRPETRQGLANKILRTLKGHLPFAGEEGLQELKDVAFRFEERVYNVATSKGDYLLKICLQMQAIEGRPSAPVANSVMPNAPVADVIPIRSLAPIFLTGPTYTYAPDYPRPTYAPDYPRPSYISDYQGSTYVPNYPRPTYAPNYPRPTYAPSYPRPMYAPSYPRPTYAPSYPRPTQMTNYPGPAYVANYPRPAYVANYQGHTDMANPGHTDVANYQGHTDMANPGHTDVANYQGHTDVANPGHTDVANYPGHTDVANYPGPSHISDYPGPPHMGNFQ